MYEYVGLRHWKKASVYDLAVWKNGLAFKNIDFSPFGRPVIKIAELKNGVTDQTARTMAGYDPSVFVRTGDMLFSWSGNPDTSIDVFRWEGEDGWLNQHIFKVESKPGVLDDFLFFVLRWLRPRFAEIARNKQTTGLGHVTIQDLKRMEVGVPDPAEQEAIVGIVGPLQNKIDANRRMNETLEAMARAIFKDWFVDFGPSRAKIEGRAPYLADDLWALFPDRLDDEGKPLGWSEGTLNDIAEVNSEVWGSKTSPPFVEYVDLSNTKWGEIEQTQQFVWDQAPSRARRILRPGDTIIGTVRPGNGSFALIGRNGLTGSTGFAVLRPRRPEYREAVYLAATARETIETLSQLADGAAYPAVRPEVVGAQMVAIPPRNCLATFSELTLPLIDRVLDNRKESTILVSLRDLLLPKLMSGEIGLKDAEKTVQEAL